MKSTIGLIIFVYIISSSCSPVLGIYGIKNPKEISKKKIVRSSKKYNLPVADVFELDTAFYSFLSSRDSVKFKNQIKNHSQPLQALYFNRSGQLESFQINCYAGGFPNITWNRDSIFSTFPPKQQAPIDTLVSVSTQIEYLTPLASSKEIMLENYDYIIFVYWSKFMGRQSKRFLNFVQRNRMIAENKRIRIIYVNNDNFYVDLW